MFSIYAHRSITNDSFPPGTLGDLLGSLDCLFDSIGAVEFSTAEKMEAALKEKMHLLEHSVTVTNRKLNQSHNEQIDISFYWARTNDLVLWMAPPPKMYPRPALFSSYGEYVQWIQWKLRARLKLNADDLARLGLEIESLKVKITSPKSTISSVPPRADALTTELELL
jgi:hypothetical protein